MLRTYDWRRVLQHHHHVRSRTSCRVRDGSEHLPVHRIWLQDCRRGKAPTGIRLTRPRARAGYTPYEGSTLRDTPLPSGTSSDAAALKAIAADCISLTDDLIDMTDSLKIGQSKSKVESLKAAVRNRRRKEKREEVEKKLERCKGQLNLQITSMSRYVESCRFSRRWNFYYHYASGWDVIAE